MQRLTRKLLQNVSAIQEDFRRSHMEEGQLEEYQFPVLPGSHLHLTDVTLEFVKFSCAVFGLAQEFQIEVGLLKRNLLELVGVREFADAAAFKNPCDPLKLSLVTCKYCDHIRDFDFCRDEDLFPSSHERTRWYCTECGCEYDKGVIEYSLLQVLWRLERSFTEQDLRCGKCKQIQSADVSKYCDCSGSYQLTATKADGRRKLRTMINVAIVHNLSRVKECAQLMYANW